MFMQHAAGRRRRRGGGQQPPDELSITIDGTDGWRTVTFRVEGGVPPYTVVLAWGQEIPLAAPGTVSHTYSQFGEIRGAVTDARGETEQTERYALIPPAPTVWVPVNGSNFPVQSGTFTAFGFHRHSNNPGVVQTLVLFAEPGQRWSFSEGGDIDFSGAGGERWASFQSPPGQTVRFFVTNDSTRETAGFETTPPTDLALTELVPASSLIVPPPGQTRLSTQGGMVIFSTLDVLNGYGDIGQGEEVWQQGRSMEASTGVWPQFVNVHWDGQEWVEGVSPGPVEP